MSRGEDFLNLYRDFEEVLSAKNGGNRAGLVQDFAYREGYRYCEEINLFREIRNLLTHHGELGGRDAVEPSDPVINKLREVLNYAKNPPAAMQAAVPAKLLYTVKLDDSVADVTAVMEEKGFSHVPITDKNNTLIGVFSVGTLFTFVKSKSQSPTAALLLRDLAEYLEPDAHSTEQFCFVGRDATCYQIKALFQHAGPGVRRVAAVFVTSNEKKDGTMLGMITPWDILRVEKG